jgi:hypothetical protein
VSIYRQETKFKKYIFHLLFILDHWFLFQNPINKYLQKKHYLNRDNPIG